MPYEDSETQEKTSILEGMMSRMNEQDRLVIENEIFNSSDVTPLSTAFEIMTDKEEVRGLMGFFEDYITDRETLSKEERNSRIKEISDFIDARL